MSAWKLLKCVILCTNPTEIGILEVIHKTVIIFTFNDLIYFSKKVPATNFCEKTWGWKIIEI